MRIAARPILCAMLSAIVFAPCLAFAGETLHNGIILPDDWPPKVKQLTREPMAVPYLEHRPDVVPIDVGRQLFVDDFLIEQTTLKRTCHTATYHPTCPVLKPDQPWETDLAAGKPCAMVFSDGVWYDPAAKLFKMWYMGGYSKATCYATSKDGIHWDKPKLDVVPGTNIVLQHKVRDSCTVWFDQAESNPAHRYKMFVTCQRRDKKGGVDLFVYYSPDGIHWGEPVATNWTGGDRSTISFDPFRKLWVYGQRASQDGVGRSRNYLECKDLIDGLHRYDQGTPWTNADRLDPVNPNPALHSIPPELYNLDVTPYESLSLGLFSIWQGDPGKPGEKRNEVLLGYSRDGFHWSRPDRRPFVGVNEIDGAWNYANMQTAGGGCLVIGDQLYFYVSGRGKQRQTDPASTGLAILRRDGFASMDAGETAGTLTTRPIVFKGKHLFVNADAVGGELRAELLDRDGQPIAPFTADRCTPLNADRTLQPVRWMDAPDLSAFAGKPIRFRFHLTHGKLYSFWVSPDESGASFGYVAAGGPGFIEPRDTVGVAAYRAAAELPASPTSQPAATQPQAALPRTGDDPAKGWVCVTPHAAFSPRDTAEPFVFAGKLWISNGWAHSPTPVRDLWNSADGVTWTRVSDNTPYDAYSEMVVYKNKVWAIMTSVWNSDDGIHWNKVLDKTPFGARGYGEVVVFKDRIWQLGSGTDVWSTTDGVHWQCATAKIPSGKRYATAVAAFDGKLWLMAGATELTTPSTEKGYNKLATFNDVWSSPDGETWTCVTPSAPWPARMWSVATAYAGRLWLIGGFDNRNAGNLGDVWSTTDGKNWQRFESPAQFAPRHEVAPYVFNGSLWVVAGNTWPVANDVWRLTVPASAGQDR